MTTVNNLNDIAKILEKSRVKQGLTKNAVLKASGISRPTLLKIINHGRIRDGYQIDSLLKVAKAMSVKIYIEESESE